MAATNIQQLEDLGFVVIQDYGWSCHGCLLDIKNNTADLSPKMKNLICKFTHCGSHIITNPNNVGLEPLMCMANSEKIHS